VNEDVRNVDGWYDAFGVTRESPMFIATDHRFRLW
jgi:predicted metalloendopeptidase